MEKESIKLIKKHFCIDNISDGQKIIFFPEQNKNEVTVYQIMDKLVIYSSSIIKKELLKKHVTNIDDVCLTLKKYNIKSSNIVCFFFADKSSKLTRRKSRNIVIRDISKDEKDIMMEFRNNNNKNDLDAGQVSLDDISPCGAFIDNKLVGISSLLKIDEIYDVGIITDSNFRKRGVGKSLVSYLVQKTIKEGKIVRYYCLIDNVGSLGIARSIGMEVVATKVTIKL